MKSILILIAVLTSFSNGLFAQEEIDTIWTRQYPDIYDAVITPDDSKVIVAIKGSIQVLDAQSGELIHTFEGTSEGDFNSLAVSNDSQFLYSGDLRKWSLLTYNVVINNSGETFINDLKLSPDGNFLYATRWANARIAKYSTNDLELVKAFTDDPEKPDIKNLYERIAISPENNTLAVAGRIEIIQQPDMNSEFYPIIKLHDPNTLEPLETIYEGEIGVSDMKFTNDSEHLAYTVNGSLFYYNLNEKNTDLKLEKSSKYGYKYLLFSPDAPQLLVNDWISFRGILYEDENFLELGELPIQMSSIYGFQNRKALFYGAGYLLYLYDLENIINGISTLELNNLKLLNNSIQFTSETSITISVYDYLGNEYITQVIEPGDVNIDLTGLEGGCYFLTINTGQSIQTIKFIRG